VTRRQGIEIVRTPEGRRILVSRRVDASPAAAWDLFTDTTRWPEWGPSITAVECEGRFVEAGTEGYVRTVGGLRVPFRIETCNDRRWTWRVAGITATGHRVESVDAGERCRIGFEIPIWAAPYVSVCLVAVRRMDRLLSSER
jgi:uncharacterized protein YndB with AHSA1/START domain